METARRTRAWEWMRAAMETRNIVEKRRTDARCRFLSWGALSRWATSSDPLVMTTTSRMPVRCSHRTRACDGTYSSSLLHPRRRQRRARARFSTPTTLPHDFIKTVPAMSAASLADLHSRTRTKPNLILIKSGRSIATRFLTFQSIYRSLSGLTSRTRFVYERSMGAPV